MRVVKVIKAERIPQKTKILKLTVDVGLSDSRIMIAGGADIYSPEYFEGKKFVAVINLAPKKIAGIESHGMLLAANANNKPFWLQVNEIAPIGAKII